VPSKAAISTRASFRSIARTAAALDREEYPRPQTTRRAGRPETRLHGVADYPIDDKGTTYRNLILQKYPDLEINFVHHAGNSSGVVDGSAALLWRRRITPRRMSEARARVVAMANMGTRRP